MLYEFQHQIEDQLRHHEAVDRHERQISELAADVSRKDHEVQGELQTLGNRANSANNALEYLRSEVSSAKQEIDAQKRLAQEIQTVISNNKVLADERFNFFQRNVSTDLNDLKAANQRLYDSVTEFKIQQSITFDAQLQKIQTIFETQRKLSAEIQLINSLLLKQSGVAGWLRRNLIALFALAIGATTTLLSFGR